MAIPTIQDIFKPETYYELLMKWRERPRKRAVTGTWNDDTVVLTAKNRKKCTEANNALW